MFVAVFFHFQVFEIYFVTYLGHDKCKTASDSPEPYNYCINNGICGSI